MASLSAPVAKEDNESQASPSRSYLSGSPSTASRYIQEVSSKSFGMVLVRRAGASPYPLMAAPFDVYRLPDPARRLSQAISLAASSVFLGVSVSLLAVSALVPAVGQVTPCLFWAVPCLGSIAICGGTLINIALSSKASD